MTAQDDDEESRRPRDLAEMADLPTLDGQAVTQPKLPKTSPKAPPAAAVFTAGQVVAGRYEIVRYIAEGGMGEVYAARDQKLQGTLALKTIRSEAARKNQALDRFLREVNVARRVTHPNVCRIYDVDEHHWPAGDADAEPRAPVTFLTMELLSGETLSERLARGPVPLDEARAIVEQMAAGLDAAHALGIIHRDFKSGNVMLVPASKGGTRVVITDFGLARAMEKDADLDSISETGVVVGTPAYMAPEQVEGKALTTAADLYALGVVMFELVTRQLPFSGGSAMSLAVKRLQEAAPSPRKFVASIDPTWETAILRCLERDPADRFASAADVARALGGERVSAGSGASARRQQRQRGLLWGGLGVLALAAGLGVWFVASRGAPSPPQAAVADASALPAAPVKPRRSLAILGVHNASGRADQQWLGTAIPEMLASELGAGEGLHLVPAGEVARVLRDLDLEKQMAALPKEALARAGRNLGVELLGTGAYTLLGSGDAAPLRVDLRVLDAATGEVMAQSSATGTQAQLFDLLSRAGSGLRQKLGLADVSPAQALEVEASLPRDREAARLYAEGLAQLRAGNPVAARDTLVKATAVEPKHPLPHAALAAAWSALGYEEKARDEARLAAAAASALPAEARAAIEARLYESERNWTKAIESYKSLASTLGLNLDNGLPLAEAQTLAGRAKEALVTLESLRGLPPPAGTDPRIDLQEARAQEALGNSKDSLAAAERARARSAERGMRTIEARALLQVAVSQSSLGNSAESMKSAEAARALAEAVGDKDWTARTLQQMARTLEKAGDLDGAARLLSRALTAYKAIGDLSSVARVQAGSARLYQLRGDPQKADAHFALALASFREVGAKHEMAPMLNNMGVKKAMAGDLAGAQKLYQEALALFGEVGDKASLAATLTNLGEVLFARGEIAQAEDMHQESLATNREIGEKGGQGYDLLRLADLAAAKGDLAVARQRYDESAKLLLEVGDRLTAAEVKLGQARLALADGAPQDAARLAREAEEVVRTEGATATEALAQVVLADALLAQGQAADAEKAADAARDLAAKSQERRARWGARRAAAEVRAASGGAAEKAAAVRELDTLALEATKAGYVGVALDMGLCAGRIEKAAGRTAAARARLSRVAQEARAKGFGLLARQAS
jgi:tetratricopeptide (TPR) repeat protein/tRNA A-37 threonylcarbamoyl transferase component Bud32